MPGAGDLLPTEVNRLEAKLRNLSNYVDFWSNSKGVKYQSDEILEYIYPKKYKIEKSEKIEKANKRFMKFSRNWLKQKKFKRSS